MTTETKPLLSWIAAAALSLGLGSSYLLDGPDQVESARLGAVALADAQRTAKTSAHREQRIARFCAEQGATAVETTDGSFTCTR